ncbi:MAG TPA: hypothetical protein VLA52_07125 [Thermohalobaculum sp.]|nr:hypothetical protein [Thermohalobaculum sp.]
MAWAAIHDPPPPLGTGELRGTGDDRVNFPSDAEIALKGWVKTLLAGEPDLRSQMWDAATVRFVARPAPVFVDRLEDLKTDADFQAIWDGLNPAQQTRVRNFFVRFLGARRFRRDIEDATTLTPGAP